MKYLVSFFILKINLCDAFEYFIELNLRLKKKHNKITKVTVQPFDLAR